MIAYQVNDPLYSTQKTANSLQEAYALRKQIAYEYFYRKNMFQSLPDDSYYAEDQKIANMFFAIKYGVVDTKYGATSYNATTKQHRARLFTAEIDGKPHWAKVADGEVIEWYKMYETVNGITYEGASYDPITEELIDVYKLDHEVAKWRKYDLNGNHIVDTYLGHFEQMPEDKKALFDDFERKYTISSWSDKSYGFIVEYEEPTSIPYDKCSDKQKEQLDNMKNEFIANNLHMFEIKEISNE